MEYATFWRSAGFLFEDIKYKELVAQFNTHQKKEDRKLWNVKATTFLPKILHQDIC